ncbi:MAG TPA: DsbA family oxidoreductase [Paracoccaceae bacterium]|nr:DsbA family oxidoreductase [Paracoccaceae bacterium]
MIPLDVISDPICPWCWIGKTRLDRAIAAAGGPPPFEIRWRPFQLNPDMPREGMDRAEYLAAKFGGREAAERVYANVEAACEEAGLDFDHSRIKRTPNTLDAHRVIRWAQVEGDQGAAVDKLFDLHFLAGRDISDPDVLIEAGAAAGLKREVVEELLASDADLDVVRAEDAAAREMGVSGVPTFIIAGKYVVQGAQDSEFWSKVIAELTEAQGAEGAGDRPDEG